MKVIKAVKERYVDVPNLRLAMYEDMDTVLMNLSMQLKFFTTTFFVSI
jgi:hypothetical protein